MLKRIVLITGATSGIGKATAKVFAKKGYHLILTGRRRDRLKEIKKNFEIKYATRILTLCFDIRNSEAVKKAIKTLKPGWSKIDILINNAGLASGLAPIYKGDIDDWEVMIDTNLKGLLYITRWVSENMVQEGKGHIINIGSTAGQEVYPNGNVYCATKYAVGALTKAMRLDLYDKNIRVSQIAPGAVEETEFSLVRFKGNKKRASIYDDYNPLRSRDVAKVIYFVASQPKHVNIENILLMGVQQASAALFDKSGRRFDTQLDQDSQL